MNTPTKPEPGLRRHTLIHGWREPAVPRPAATLVLMRTSPGGLEVLLTRRSATAPFAPDAWVFPGGVIAPSDASLPAAGAAHPAARRASAAAALRETFEELGIVLARHAGRQPAVPPAQAASLDRSPQPGLAAQLRAQRWELDLDALVLWSHWTTSPDLPLRFATDFWLALMPEGQVPQPDGREQLDARWWPPTHALAEHAAGRLPLLLPTEHTLRQLQAWPDAAALWRHAASTQHEVIARCPRAGWLGGQPIRLIDSDPAYGELALVTPDGQVAHELDWQSDTPRRLSTLVQRLTAPNPGMMTGPGTNTYIVGDARGFIVIDPGPDHPDHLARLIKCVGGALRAIVCTHGHADHAAGAAPLNQALGGHIPIVGRPSGPQHGRHPPFTPTQGVRDGERLHLPDLTLRVLHTPGHAQHHVCLLLEEDQLLFSGDHILNGSTSLIEPPDGHMGDYLASLARLAQEPIAFILPAHGHVLGPARTAIAALLAHRHRREHIIQQALARLGPTPLADLVQTVYNDVPADRHRIALGTLRAHLEWLAQQGQARETAAGWEQISF